MGKRGPKPGAGGGRPRKLKFDDATIAKIEAYATCGLSQEEIALLLGVSPATMSRSKGYSEKLSESIKVGQAKGHTHVASKLVSQINAGSVAATIFYLKSRCKWNDRPDLKDAVDELGSVFDRHIRALQVNSGMFASEDAQRIESERAEVEKRLADEAKK